jgi:methyltransferase (TIGR00027 family)
VLPIALRTRYFDDFLQRITRQEKIRQIVLPAAGLDTRAYRLLARRNPFLEIDQPVVRDHKEQILNLAQAKPRCARHTIGLDLTGNWKGALIQVGSNPRIPSGWLLEGFLFYLPKDSITMIIDQVTSLSAAGSWLGFDIINSIMLTHPLTKQWVEMQAAAGAPWIGTIDDPVDFLEQRDWKASLSQAGASDANHNRWPYPVIPTTMPDNPHNWYVTATRKP